MLSAYKVSLYRAIIADIRWVKKMIFSLTPTLVFVPVLLSKDPWNVKRNYAIYTTCALVLIVVVLHLIQRLCMRRLAFWTAVNFLESNNER